MFKLDLEKVEEPEIKLPTFTGSSVKQESSRKTSISALLTAKGFDSVAHNKLWTILQEMGIPDHLTLRNLPLEKSVCRSESNWTWNNRLIPNRERSTSRLYIVTCLFNSYSEYIMRNTGLEEPKLESRLLEEILITSDMQMRPPLWQKVKKK